MSDATANTISSVDFAGLVAGSCNSLFGSIPASGHLTSDIVYQFAVGDSGLAYPSDNGVTVGVTGTVTYQGTEYPGAKTGAAAGSGPARATPIRTTSGSTSRGTRSTPCTGPTSRRACST